MKHEGINSTVALKMITPPSPPTQAQKQMILNSLMHFPIHNEEGYVVGYVNLLDGIDVSKLLEEIT